MVFDPALDPDLYVEDLEEEEEEDFSIADLVLDAGRGVVAGFEGAARGVVGLVTDPIFGTNISNDRFFERSQTVVGGFVEAGAQFVLPFGLISKFGNFGRETEIIVK